MSTQDRCVTVIQYAGCCRSQLLNTACRSVWSTRVLPRQSSVKRSSRGRFPCSLAAAAAALRWRSNCRCLTACEVATRPKYQARRSRSDRRRGWSSGRPRPVRCRRQHLSKAAGAVSAGNAKRQRTQRNTSGAYRRRSSGVVFDAAFVSHLWCLRRVQLHIYQINTLHSSFTRPPTLWTSLIENLYLELWYMTLDTSVLSSLQLKFVIYRCRETSPVGGKSRIFHAIHA